MASKLQIKLLPGEKWWGGASNLGIHMPFGENDFSFDLRIHVEGNQGAPLLISNKGRFVYAHEAFKFSFQGDELYIEGKGDIEIGSTIEVLENAVLKDTALKDAFRHVSKTYFPASGTYPDDLFFRAPQYNTWIEMGYTPTQQQIISYAESILANGLPPGIFMIDDGWNEDYGVWEFKKASFPNPQAMVEQLHQMGFKVMLWTCPFVSPDSVAFRHLEKNGWLIKDRNNKTAIRNWWNGYSALLDLTNDETVAWYVSQNKRLMDEYGVDGFKMDAGDPDFYEDTDICAKPVSRMEQAELWARIGLNYRFNEYRACWKLGGQALVQRLRDKRHRWDDDGLNTLVPNGIAQGLLGYAFVCPDLIGGGSNGDFEDASFSLDQELVVRYAQCSALFPMMQFSIAPWRVLDQAHFEICMETVRLHIRFADEIVELAKHAALTGEPMIRHMAYEFQDTDYSQVNDQFMLGSDILVAPVLNKGQTKRKIVFPAGKWQGDDGSLVEGPCKIEVEAPLSRLPWYRKLY